MCNTVKSLETEILWKYSWIWPLNNVLANTFEVHNPTKRWSCEQSVLDGMCTLSSELPRFGLWGRFLLVWKIICCDFFFFFFCGWMFSFICSKNVIASQPGNSLFPGNLKMLGATRHFYRLFRVPMKKGADEKALISSISTPKPMESKSIILRLFGTLPVLLRQNSQKSWWQIFPVKKPMAWLCLIIIIVWWGWKQMSTETRLGYFKIQHTQGNLPLAYLWQPHGAPEGFYWEQLRQNENRAIRAIMRRIFSRDFRYKVCCVRRKEVCDVEKYGHVVHKK